MLRRYLLPFCLPLFISSLVACGDEADSCFRSTDCEIGFQCDATSPGTQGSCIACDANETPYDGLDNDCNPRTVDVDLDGDGDNFIDSPIQPGGDCDDMNPKASSLQIELCNDSIDNDCDGMTDEDDCGDLGSPYITINAPSNGDFVRGTVIFDMEITDDTWVATVEIFTSEVTLRTEPVQDREQEKFMLPVDTTRLDDGLQRISVRATDPTGKSTERTVQVTVDNNTGPALNVLSPENGKSYGGQVRIEVEASRPGDVSDLVIRVDNVDVLTATTGPFRVSFDSTLYPDGPLGVEIVATDPFGQQTVLNPTIQVDNTGPTFSVTPPPGSTLSGTIVFAISGADPAGVDGVRALGEESMTSELTITAEGRQLPNGPFELEVTGTDGAIVDGFTIGNSGTQTFVYTVSGGINADLDLVDPLAGGYAYQGPGFFEATSSVRTLNWYANGQLVGTSQNVSGKHTVSVDLSDFALGPVMLEARGFPNGSTFEVVRRATVTLVPAAKLQGTRGALVTKEGGFTNLSGCGSGVVKEVAGFGDFDGDGVLDVFGCEESVKATLHFGDAGAWPARRSVRLPGVASAVRMADLNGDQFSDLILLTQQGALQVYFGNNLGTVNSVPGLTAQIAGVLSNATLLIDDFDGDLDPDILVSLTVGPDEQLLFFANDVNQLSPVSPISRPGGTWAKLVDVDGDNVAEIVTLESPPNQPSSLRVFRRTGPFTLSAPISTQLPTAVGDFDVGDVSGDGYPDLVIVTADQVAVSVGSSASVGVYGAPVEAGPITEGKGVLLTELDGQPGLDAIVSATYRPDRARGAALFLLNDGSGNLTEVERYAVIYGRSINHLDWDGDGVLDVIIGGSEGPGRERLEYLRGQGGLSFEGTRLVPNPEDLPSITFALVGDLVPGGSLSDLVLPVDNEIHIFENLGDGNYAPAATHTFLSQLNGGADMVVFGLASGDLDGQNGPDIVVSGFGEAVILYSQANGSYSGGHISPPFGGTVTELADLTGDGVPEIILGAGMEVQIRPADGGTPIFTGALVADPFRTVVGNIDPDAAKELVVDTHLIDWNGSSFTDVSIPELNGTLALGDQSGDGAADLSSLNGAGQLELLLANGTGFELTTSSYQVDPTQGSQLLSTDVNGDGLEDLVAGGLVLIARPDGGYFRKGVPWLGGEVCQQLTLARFDSSSVPEILCFGTTYIRSAQIAP